MKKLNIVIVAGALLILPLTGATCKPSQVQTTIKAEGVLITSVDTGMELWRDYVTMHQSDGKVTQAQIDKVHQAYNAYYAAQQSAKAAIERVMVLNSTNSADAITAQTAVISAEQSLLNLLNEYLK